MNNNSERFNKEMQNIKELHKGGDATVLTPQQIIENTLNGWRDQNIVMGNTPLMLISVQKDGQLYINHAPVFTDIQKAYSLVKAAEMYLAQAIKSEINNQKIIKPA